MDNGFMKRSVWLVAVAALDLQLRRLGYDMADEFNQRLLAKMAASAPPI